MLTGLSLVGFICFTPATPPTILGRGYKLSTPARIADGSYTTIPDVALDNTDCIPLFTGNAPTGTAAMYSAFINAAGTLITMNQSTASATGVQTGTGQCIVFKVDNNR